MTQRWRGRAAIAAALAAMILGGCTGPSRFTDPDARAAAAELRAEARRGAFEPLFDQLALCQLFHLTNDGYLRVAKSQFFTDVWTRADVDALTRDARLRPSRRTDLRSTVQLQLSFASSYQAATSFAALGGFMDDEAIAAVSRADLADAAAAAYAARLAAEGYAGCAVIKWGNRHPDLFAQPMRRSTFDAVEALFGANAPSDLPLVAVETDAIGAGRLTEAEIVELRAIRIAAYLFEREFELLRADRGGFEGNLEDAPLVCTDEATTLWFFLDWLERRGLLTHFETQDGRFVHRRPTLVLPTDHFGVLLRNRRTGAFFAIDSWVEDGGIPPHIAAVDDWFAQRERRSVVSIGDARLDAALTAATVAHDDANGLFTALNAHLERFAPAEQTPRADGRPQTCGFRWCGPAPVDTW